MLRTTKKQSPRKCSEGIYNSIYSLSLYSLVQFDISLLKSGFLVDQCRNPVIEQYTNYRNYDTLNEVEYRYTIEQV